MKHSLSTYRTCKPLALLLIAPLLILQGCAVKPPVPSNWPELPSKPSVSMPPTPSEISTGVQADLKELETRRQKRVQRLTP